MRRRKRHPPRRFGPVFSTRSRHRRPFHELARGRRVVALAVALGGCGAASRARVRSRIAAARRHPARRSRRAADGGRAANRFRRSVVAGGAGRARSGAHRSRRSGGCTQRHGARLLEPIARPGVHGVEPAPTAAGPGVSALGPDPAAGADQRRHADPRRERPRQHAARHAARSAAPSGDGGDARAGGRPHRPATNTVGAVGWNPIEETAENAKIAEFTRRSRRAPRRRCCSETESRRAGPSPARRSVPTAAAPPPFLPTAISARSRAPA